MNLPFRPFWHPILGYFYIEEIPITQKWKCFTVQCRPIVLFKQANLAISPKASIIICFRENLEDFMSTLCAVKEDCPEQVYTWMQTAFEHPLGENQCWMSFIKSNNPNSPSCNESDTKIWPKDFGVNIGVIWAQKMISYKDLVFPALFHLTQKTVCSDMHFSLKNPRCIP